MDVLNFFTWPWLSELYFLDLSGNIQILSWDCLTTQLLTILSLQINLPVIVGPSFEPSLPITSSVIPKDNGDRSMFQVPLCTLKRLHLTEELHHVFGLLDRVALPATLDFMSLTASNSTAEDVSQISGPYLRGCSNVIAGFRVEPLLLLQFHLC